MNKDRDFETSTYTRLNVNLVKLEGKKEVCCPTYIRNSEKVTSFPDLKMYAGNNII